MSRSAVRLAMRQGCAATPLFVPHANAVVLHRRISKTEKKNTTAHADGCNADCWLRCKTEVLCQGQRRGLLPCWHWLLHKNKPSCRPQPVSLLGRSKPMQSWPKASIAPYQTLAANDSLIHPCLTDTAPSMLTLCLLYRNVPGCCPQPTSTMRRSKPSETPAWRRWDQLHCVTAAAAA